MNGYHAKALTDETGRRVYCVANPQGSLVRAAAQYRGDAGRIRKFRTMPAAEAFARHMTAWAAEIARLARVA